MDEVFLPSLSQGEDKSSAFANCIRNNYRHVRKWAKRTNTNAFRIYDRQINHYPLAIDFYAGRFCVHYFSSSKENFEPSEALQEEVNATLRSLFIESNQGIFWRIRSRQKETRQYEKRSEKREFFPVLEYGVKFLVNLTDYLDTGLFLDHRETRKIVASLAKDKRLLNLFAYTCSFSVHAAAQGALFTKSVDMSNTYTDWGRENFLINNLPTSSNPIVRADCMKFLSEEATTKTKYDIIVIDPPTISRSKKMEDLFDVHVDYIFLITKALELLSPGGVIFFSTNSRKFVFDTSLFPSCQIQDISKKTLPIDFHDPRIHFCWKISPK